MGANKKERWRDSNSIEWIRFKHRFEKFYVLNVFVFFPLRRCRFYVAIHDNDCYFFFCFFIFCWSEFEVAETWQFSCLQCHHIFKPIVRKWWNVCARVSKRIYDVYKILFFFDIFSFHFSYRAYTRCVKHIQIYLVNDQRGSAHIRAYYTLHPRDGRARKLWKICMKRMLNRIAIMDDDRKRRSKRKIEGERERERIENKGHKDYYNGKKYTPSLKSQSMHNHFT